MLKRGLAFALALVMLASVSVAGATGMEIEKNGQWYTEVSAWAKDGVEKAIDLGVAYWPSRWIFCGAVGTVIWISSATSPARRRR